MSTPSRSPLVPGFIHPLTRRRLLVGGGAALAIGGLTSRLPVFAQDAATPPAAEEQGPTPSTPTAELPTMPPELTQFANDWPTPQGNLSNHRANANTSITASNVASLDVAWTFPVTATGGFGGMTCTPIIAGQAVYVQDMLSNVFALDRDSGAVIWEKDYNATTEGPNGVSIGYGMIYGATGDNREVFALDVTTGEEVWRTILSGNTREGIDMAPAVYGGTVYVSTVPGNSQEFYSGGARGVLFALDAATGEILWQFYTTDADLWGNPSVNSGGGAWYPPAIGADGNLYWDIANPAPFEETSINGTPIPVGSTRPGPNLYTNCMVALGPDGHLNWFYEANPHDIQDHDLQQSPVMVEVANNGNPYTVLLGSGKLGKVIAIEATTGNMVWTAKVGQHNQWDDAQWFPPGQTISVQPAVIGGVESPIAYADGTVYVPVFNGTTDWTSSGLSTAGLNLAESTGELAALDIVDGSMKWSAQMPAASVSGATVANDVVFAAALDGIARAYSTQDGTLLWSFQTGAGSNAPMAVAGDLLVVPAAGVKLVSQNYAPEASPVAGNVDGPAVIGLKVTG
jgi:outer membrane protein assembly factor BamB